MSSRSPIMDRVPSTAGRAPIKSVDVVDVSHEFRSANGPAVQVLQPTTIKIRPGEFTCLVGPSGCGKTTLLNMAAGLVAPTDGKITLSGRSPQVGDPDVGYLLARDSLLPWRTALSNVMFPLELRGVDKHKATQRATVALQDTGLGDFLHSYPAQLSHGMRQRTAVARTLVTEPSTILMDEPFSALDAETRMQLQQKFLQLWERQKATVMFVTHDLSEAIALGDRILVFSARPGRVKQEFTIDLPRPRDIRQLQMSPQYHDLFQEIWSVFQEEVNL